ncbi:MAG: caspase family protein [Acidobacteria bacterium]|nr:caspase family protein [Acidobacteriota bacterium]
MPKNSPPKVFALLIGIDRYSQIPLPDGTYYPHLGGCVRDAEHVAEMLKSRLGLPDGQIFKLTSTRGPDDRPLEPAKRLPTYKNIVRAFRDVTARAAAGDLVYIHYSGHGGRSATMFPELKGRTGLDESLVPCDIGEAGGGYLRDVELACLLKTMAEKKLLVTLVLDSCHSGGATRGEAGAVPRGIASIDTRPPQRRSLVASRKTLTADFQSFPEAARNFAPAKGWNLPLPENCVFIAACRANELASEYAFDGKERNGALTYWMLDALRQTGPGYTYRMLYNRVVAKVHAKFVNQTPQIEGDRDREIFGAAALASAASVNVLKVDPAGRRVLLNTGFAQGVSRGAQFAVYPAAGADFSDPAGRLAVVELGDPEATETWAAVVSGERAGELEEGMPAVLLGVGIRLRGRVRLDRPGGEFAAAVDDLADYISRSEGDLAARDKWIRLAAAGEDADFQVTIDGDGEFAIRDAAGRPVPNLRPVVRAGEPGASAKIFERLVQLTKYRNVRLIDNTDPASPLARKLTAELGLMQKNRDRQKTFVPLGVPARPLATGERAGLRVTNLSDTALNVVVLDLAPDWSVAQIYPDPGQKDYELLEPGVDNALVFEMEAGLPLDYQEGTDVLKVFATVEGTSFRWLQMSPLDAPPAEIGRSLPTDALEQLLTAFAAPDLRNMKPVVNLSTPKSRFWTTVEVEARVRRATIAHVADPALSLLQSAFDETIAREQSAAKSRSVNGTVFEFSRPELSHPIVNEIAQYCVAVAQNRIDEQSLRSFDRATLDDAGERGIVDTVRYCASMAVGVAREWFNAKIWGDDAKYEAYKQALTAKFGDCDTHYKESLLQYLKFLREGGHVPYRTPVDADDFVVDGLPENAVVGVVGDWATGEPEALEVLRQVRGHDPQVAIHLGDIYYAGTEFEVENYFYRPWTAILDPENSKILSFALPGNHDLYAGGKPFYALLDRLQALNGFDRKMASYFCLRNRYWQLIGLDTALHDRLGAGPTYLEQSELEWLRDKIDNAGDRRTILFSHHQLFSADDQFDGQSCNRRLYDQLAPLLPKIALWQWGHEHNLVVFEPFMNLERGRCVGGSAFPVGNFEMPATAKNADVPVNREVALSRGDAFYTHCYSVIRLDGAAATVSYYEDRDGGRLLFEEKL